MKKTIVFISLFILYSSATVSAQTGFRFFKKEQKQQQIRFELINNLIIIPLEINGKELSFILDTGVNKTILFNLSKNDSLGLKNVRKVQLRGLGDGEPVDALLSRNNRFRLKNLVSNNQNIYVILKDKFDLSAKMGTTIHGIIGYSLLKDLILKINYKSKRIDFFDPKTYKYKKCRKCETFPLLFFRRKPFIDVTAQLDTVGDRKTQMKMLIDSGGSDAVWLFENTKEEIKTPKRFFRDILGEGLSGTIYGNRSRIPELSIGKFRIKKPTVSFLDTVSTINARDFKQRNGSIGGNILRRFKVWIDYPNRKITFRKNASLRDGFNYNMSGLDIVYDGKKLVREQESVSLDSYSRNAASEGNNNAIFTFITSYSYKFKPSFKINKVAPDSPGERAGLQKGDILIRLNGNPIYEYKLSDIISLFQEKDRKKIKMTVERNGQKLKFQFRLEKRV